VAWNKVDKEASKKKIADLYPGAIIINEELEKL